MPVIATRVGRARRPRHATASTGCWSSRATSSALTEALKRFYAPGEPERLRSGVKAVDPEPFWSSYSAVLLDA